MVSSVSVPLVIAHRGASAAYPENTLAAFVGAAEMGADWVELDVRRTADRTLAIAHDAELADGTLLVDLGRVELPSSVPDLAAALDACAPMGVNIEIKNSPGDPDHDPDHALADGVVDLLAERARRQCGDRVLISSFNPFTLARVRHLDASLATAQLFVDPWPTLHEDVVAGGHVAVHPPDWETTETFVIAAHDSGLAVNVWTVDDRERMEELAAWGVDGIVTNVPDLARQVLGVDG